MKKLILALAIGATTTSFAQNISLKNFNNWQLTDIRKLGFNKDVLFSQMDKELIKVGSSICSNRAMVWTYDFKRKQNIDAAKIFMFYTDKKTGIGEITWWYHVAPVINDNGKIVVMDAGFPGYINGPVAVFEWLQSFAHTTRCKEIQANETELIEKMFQGMIFPKTTQYGTYDCYYTFAPAGYWTPTSVAMGLLGVNDKGEPVNYSREEIELDEVYQACVEAVTKPLGRILGSGNSRCKKYLGIKPD